jgi:3-hydroxypropanoate dehydrogenase
MTTLTLEKLDDEARALVFTGARTSNTFSDTPVSDDELRDIWNLTKWTPTMANTQPLRVLFVRDQDGKKRLLHHIAEGNAAKTESAPVTAILAVDKRWHDQIPTVFPIRPEMKDAFEGNEDVRVQTGTFSAALQAGAFILATRAAGLAAGPIKGYDAAGIDQEFFADGDWTTILVINIGHPGENPWFDRLPRVPEDQAIAFA